VSSIGRHRRAYQRRVGRSRIAASSAGLVAAAAAAVLLTAGAAHAQYFDPFFGPRYSVRSRTMAPVGPNYFKPKRKRVEAAKKEPSVKPPPGPLLIAISLHSQRLTLYSNGAPIAHAPVSTGTPGHPTPIGIFSVIGKERFHRSNLYSNAPMPWMQRITWSGVAMHQGVLPGYPASHGCIRLPGSFAQYLFATTRMGARVIITRDDVAPFDIAHANLFAPRPKPEEEPPGDQVQAKGALKVAESDDPVTTSDAPRTAARGAAEQSDAIKLKGSLDPRMPDSAANRIPAGSNARRTAAAAEASDIVDAQEPSPTATDAARAGEAAGSTNKGGRAAAAEVKETPRMSEPVSVFVSRKAGRLYVRQGFEPLFDTPVTIREPDAPLGTHLYTAMDFTEDRTAMRWTAVTLPTRPVAEPEPRPRSAKRTQDPERAAPVPAAARLAAAAALDRIEMPKEALDRISELLSPGASLIISDYPLSGETGKYTDFIILTR
jgi:lipoprotein-anchoring transpeptidase ErfK/SrfK